MAPVSAPDREVDVSLPSLCPDCGGEVEFERTAEQFQVDLPPMRPVTTKFNLRVGHCKGCGKRVQGRHAEQTSDALGAASSQVGPSAKAWAAWLHYGLGLSFAKTASLLHRLGINLTAGALSQAAQSTSTALVPVQDSIVKAVNDSPMIVPDESGWRVGGEGAWLWAASSARATAYWVADGRGFDEACEVISPEYSGVMVRDGWVVYRRFDKATHQTCLAHLTRRCDELITDLPAGARHTPRQVREILTEALAARDLDDDERAAVVADLTERVEMLAEDAHQNDENRKLVAHLYAERDALFTFLTHPGTDATNWRAEQAIRPAVVNRKVGRQPDLVWRCHPGTHDERAADRISARSRRHRLPGPSRPGPHAGRGSVAFHLKRRLFGSAFTELREVAPRYPSTRQRACLGAVRAPLPPGGSSARPR